MDTQKVQDLLAKIQNAERAERDAEKELGAVQERLTAQRDLVLALKRELAEELRDMLDDGRRKRAEAPGDGSRKRQPGLGAAVMAAVEAGQPRAKAEIARDLAEKGYATKNLGMTLSYLVKKNQLKRVGRGEYAKA